MDVSGLWGLKEENKCEKTLEGSGGQRRLENIRKEGDLGKIVYTGCGWGDFCFKTKNVWHPISSYPLCQVVIYSIQLYSLKLKEIVLNIIFYVNLEGNLEKKVTIIIQAHRKFKKHCWGYEKFLLIFKIAEENLKTTPKFKTGTI